MSYASLRFDRETEARYLSDLTAFYVPVLRLVVSFVVLFYLLYFGGDWWLFRRFAGTGIDLLMLGIAAPAAALGVAITFLPVSDRLIRAGVFAATSVNGICQVWSYDIGFSLGMPIPYEGMILIMFLAFFVLGIQLRWAMLLSVALTAAHLAVSHRSGMAHPILFDHATMMSTVILIGALSGHVLDLLTRRNWVNENRLRELAERDPLTGLYNRRHFDELLPRRMAEHRRSGRSFSLLMIDIDHFKRINDQYGHDAGDQVLREVAARLQQTLRREEAAFRLGGEEFVLMIEDGERETGPAQAHACAERIRREIEAMRIQHNDQPLPAITLSIGVARYPADVIDASGLLQRADAALYAAKRAGRNRVCHVAALPSAAPVR